MFGKFLAILVTLAALTGCSHKDPKIYTQDGPVADGDMLIESSIGDAKTLNPALVDESTGGDIDSMVFSGLLRYNKDLELEPCLAEKWTVSKDGKTVTYYLRKGVKFHDGVEFTANDVLFTYKVYSDPTVNTPYGADYQYIKTVEIMDPYIVKVTYKKPFAPALTNTFTSILPKHLLEGKDINHDDEFNRHPIGTGPYKFVEWKTAQQIVLEANPDYWEGKPHIKRFVLRVIPDQSSEFLSLLKGEVDAMGAWTSGTLSPEQYARQTDTPKFRDFYNKYQTDQFVYTYLGWNLANPLFKDVKVRRALTMAIDRQAIIQNVVYGLGSVCTGPFVPSSWAYNKSVQPLPYDPAKARELLKQAGWKPGPDGVLTKGKTAFRFKLYTNQGNVSRERIATIIQQQLKEIGVDCQPQIIEWTTLLSQYINKRKYDAMVMGWQFGPEPDCYLSWHSSQMGEHQYNMVGYKNKTVDSLLVQGRETLDPAKRARIYQRIHKILAEDVAATFLYVPYSLPAVHKRFKGLDVNRNGIGWHAEKWYVPANQQKYKP
ncbi:MAG TPA: peptide-binding protein [bacterium]|nr:peptide-binding protein [bacterium]